MGAPHVCTPALKGIYFHDYDPTIPAQRGRLRRQAVRRSGMRRPAGRLVTGSREAFGQNRPPATTSGTCECSLVRRRGHRRAGTVRKLCPDGPGGHKSRGGAPRGVRPALSGARAGVLALRACVIGPRTGADAPVAPVGAPPPQGAMGIMQASEGVMPRGKDDACPDVATRSSPPPIGSGVNSSGDPVFWEIPGSPPSRG